MFFAQLVSDKLIFHALDNTQQIARNNNVALACVEAGIFVGSSSLIGSCMEAENLGLCCTFFVLGMGAMVAFSRGCAFTHRFLTSICLICISLHLCFVQMRLPQATMIVMLLKTIMLQLVYTGDSTFLPLAC